MKRFPTKSLIYWGILAAKAANEQKSKRLSRRWHSLTKTGMRWYHYFTWVSCFNTHCNRGNPPPSLRIQHGVRASREGRSLVYKSSAKVQAWWNLKVHNDLIQKRSLRQTSNKKVRPHKIRKKTLCPKRYYLSNRTPRASGRLAMKAYVRWLLQLRMVANLHVQWRPMQSRNTLSKNKELDKSQIWKKRLRQKWASRWTENLKGWSRQKLETWTKMIILIDWKPEKGDICKS